MAACSRLSHDGGTPENKEQSSKSNGAIYQKSSEGPLRAVNKKAVTYRHIPHCQKPPHLVQRRNARERRRVQAVNGAFTRLRKHVPYEPKHKRLSKVKTLRVAIDYIRHMEDLIRDHDQRRETRRDCATRQVYVNADNTDIVENGRGWIYGHNNVYPEQQRRCPRLVHYPPVCPPGYPNYPDICNGPLL